MDRAAESGGVTRPSLREDAILRRAMKRSERASAAATLRSLRRELGAWTALGVVLDLLAQRARGEPFGALGRAVDRREALSRRQAAPVVQLYRALARRLDEERALELTAAAVRQGGLIFLGSMLARVDPRTVSPTEAGRRLEELVGRFFNAEGELRMESERAVCFDVRRCRFAELLEAVGEPALKPLFCEVDRAYFTAERTPIRLRRSRTLAAGDERCDFRFEWDE